MIILIMGMLCTRLNLAIKSLMQGQFAKTELTTVYSPADINPSSLGHGLIPSYMRMRPHRHTPAVLFTPKNNIRYK